MNPPNPQVVVPLGSITGAANVVDGSAGNVHTATLAGNVSIALKNIRPGQEVEVLLTQDGTGLRTVSWAGAGGMTVTAPSAASLVPSTAAGLYSAFTFVGIDATNVRLVSSQLGA